MATIRVDMLQCPRCGGINCRQRSPESAPTEWRASNAMATISRAKKHQCMLLLRKAVHKRAGKLSIAAETAVAALVPILSSSDREELLPLPAPASDGQGIDVASGQGREFFMQLLELAHKVAPPAPPEEQSNSKRPKNIEKTTKRPEHAGRKLNEAVSNSRETHLRLPASAIPHVLAESHCEAARWSAEIEKELRALSIAPLGPFVQDLQYTVEEVGSRKTQEPASFDPRVLVGILSPEGTPYLERLGAEVAKLTAGPSEKKEDNKEDNREAFRKVPLLCKALAGVLGGQPNDILDGGLAAGASLHAMTTVKRRLMDRLRSEREQMDAAWSRLRAHFAFPNNSCPPRMLLATLFSTRAVQDLARLTQLQDGKAESLAAALGLLMLRSVRVAQLDLCAALSQDDLHGQFVGWLVRALRCASDSHEAWPRVEQLLEAKAGAEGREVLNRLQERCEVGDEDKDDLHALLGELLRAADGLFDSLGARRVHGEWQCGFASVLTSVACW
ncbi:unnamed protein product [Prorocentrum cordatum]|uniref:Uncharacterized protein n=1 Tax=Prorocentrum cordatum TaxID=2364126 RepID=A0ABN9WFJ0_9DINO|nr:unnamed protein product [Polarella glacialis]